MLPSAGGDSRIVADNVGPLANELAWGSEANGGFLYFAAGPGLWHVWRVAASGGPPQQLDISPGVVKHLSVNPDGRRIAVSGGTARHELFSLENI